MAKSREIRDLRRYVKAMHRSLEREIITRHELGEAELDRRVGSIQREASQAATDLSNRLDAMNEFRQAMADQYARAMTRADFETAFDGLDDRINKVEKILDTQRGRQYAYAAIAGILSVLLTIFILVAAHIHVS